MARPPVALYRLHYDRQARRVTYAPKHRQDNPGHDAHAGIHGSALDFLAALCSHIPDAGQQLIRYYGEWSHVRRARARTVGAPAVGAAPCSVSPNGGACPGKRTRARLIKKVYEADPLLCRRCSGRLKMVSLIDAPAVIEKILRHLRLWGQPQRPPPAAPPPTVHYEMGLPAWEEDAGPFARTE